MKASVAQLWSWKRLRLQHLMILKGSIETTLLWTHYTKVKGVVSVYIVSVSILNTPNMSKYTQLGKNNHCFKSWRMLFLTIFIVIWIPSVMNPLWSLIFAAAFRISSASCQSDKLETRCLLLQDSHNLQVGSVESELSGEFLLKKPHSSSNSFYFWSLSGCPTPVFDGK